MMKYKKHLHNIKKENKANASSEGKTPSQKRTPKTSAKRKKRVTVENAVIKEVPSKKQLPTPDATESIFRAGAVSPDIVICPRISADTTSSSLLTHPGPEAKASLELSSVFAGLSSMPFHNSMRSPGIDVVDMRDDEIFNIWLRT